MSQAISGNVPSFCKCMMSSTAYDMYKSRSVLMVLIFSEETFRYIKSENLIEEAAIKVDSVMNAICLKCNAVKTCLKYYVRD